MSIGIGLGLMNFPFARAAQFFDWVELCERHRVDSLWQSDRLISTVDHLEPLATMATLAGITEHLRFGVNVLVAPLRDPLVLAKQCATIDYLSDGRLLPMFGVGRTTAPEWQASGRSVTERKQRGNRTNEMLVLMNRLWTETSVTFDGQYFQYAEATISPRPRQQPLPVWIGGHSEAAIQRTARFGTGWIGGLISANQVKISIAAIKEALVYHRRTIDEDHYGATIAFRIGGWDDPEVARYPLLQRPDLRAESESLKSLLCIGDSRHLSDRIQRYIAAGASKFVLFPIAAGYADMCAQTERLVNDVIPLISR